MNPGLWFTAGHLILRPIRFRYLTKGDTKMVKAITITTDNTVTCFDMDKNSLELLQKAVGGYVQAINLDDTLTLWCNEEGKMMNLPHNEKAQILWDNVFGSGTDYIVGNIVLTGGADDEGEIIGLTDEQINNLVFS